MIKLLILALFATVYEANAFLENNDNTACNGTEFIACSDNWFGVLSINSDTANIDPEALYKFYCGNNYTKMMECMKGKLNPSCGPGTVNWNMKQSLASVDPHMLDALCRNDSTELDLLSCSTKLPKVKGYSDCIIGETLNKTVDPTDQCNFMRDSFACGYKYVSLMCPAALPSFESQLPHINGCPSVDIHTVPEATSCDAQMEKACDVAYNPPQLLTGATIPQNASISNGMELFLCSAFGQNYIQCLDKVDNLCKTDPNNLHSNLPLVKDTLAKCA